MTEFMGRKLGAVQSGRQHMFLYQTMDRSSTDAISVTGSKKSLIISKHFFVAFDEIGINCFPAGGSKIDKSLLISLTDHTDPILIHIRQI